MEEVLSVRSAEADTDEDLHTILSRMIVAVSQDHAQLRMLVYEFVRRKLRRNLYQQFEDGDWSGVQEQMRALEAVIDQVETDFLRKTLTVSSELQLTHPEVIFSSRPDSQTAAASPGAPIQFLHSLPHEIKSQLRAVPGDKYLIAVPERRSRLASWLMVQLTAAALLGVIIYAAIDGKYVLSLLNTHKPEAPVKISAVNVGNANENKTSTVQSAPLGIPTPSDYGVYALSNGKLTELETLPMRVPDSRVAISPVITTPSLTHLPPGELQFVAFRRDLVNNAPDKVSVRVIAQVKRALTFNAGGKASVAPVNDSWVVRSNSYQMKVAPVPNNPEMVMIRPDQTSSELPAGRYVLVIKNVAYDFTIDGPRPDAAHCLERTDALNTPVYTECRDL